MSKLHPLDRLLVRMIIYDTLLGIVITELIFVISVLTDPTVLGTSSNQWNEFVIGFIVSIVAGAFLGCFIGMLNGFFTGIFTHFYLRHGYHPVYRRVVMSIAILFTSLFVLPIVVLLSWEGFQPALFIGFIIIVAIAVYASQRVASQYLRETDVRKSKVK